LSRAGPTHLLGLSLKVNSLADASVIYKPEAQASESYFIRSSKLKINSPADASVIYKPEAPASESFLMASTNAWPAKEIHSLALRACRKAKRDSLAHASDIYKLEAQASEHVRLRDHRSIAWLDEEVDPCMIKR